MPCFKELGLEGNTLVVFASDNGPVLKVGGSAAPFPGSKHSFKEGGFRVPCIVRWPGHVVAGKISDALVAAMDFMPTFADITGALLPDDRVLDGFNVWPILSQGLAESPRKDFVYYDFDRPSAIRSGNWKLHYNWDGDAPKKLYDLSDRSRRNQ